MEHPTFLPTKVKLGSSSTPDGHLHNALVHCRVLHSLLENDVPDEPDAALNLIAQVVSEVCSTAVDRLSRYNKVQSTVVEPGSLLQQFS